MNIHYSSGSEIDMYLACERKHWYAFGKKHNPSTPKNGLQLLQHSDNLTRGTIGHTCLENYYKFIKEGMNRDGAFLKARDIHMVDMATNLDRAELYTQVLRMFTEYHTRYMQEEFKPLALEHEFEYKIDSDSVFVIKPDGVFQYPTGKIHIVDHKFLYRFYQERVYPILPQMLRYAAVLRQLGYEVHKTTYNMVCTDPRIKTENMFKRHHTNLEEPNIERKMVRFWEETVETVQQINKLKENPEAWERSARRNASSFTCANCPFLELCSAEAEQQNGIEIMLRTYYKPNEYGYNKTEEEV